MSSETERVYTINLGKVLLSPDNRRAKRAINMMREFARHHMGVTDVKIDEDISHQIWKRGIRHPPRKIRVRMYRTDEGHILISKYEGEAADAATESAAKPVSGKDAKAKPALEVGTPETKDTAPADTPAPKSDDTVSADKPKPKEGDAKPAEKPKSVDTKPKTGSKTPAEKPKNADANPKAESKTPDKKPEPKGKDTAKTNAGKKD